MYLLTRADCTAYYYYLITIIASLSCDTHTQLLQPRKVNTVREYVQKNNKISFFWTKQGEEDCDLLHARQKIRKRKSFETGRSFVACFCPQHTGSDILGFITNFLKFIPFHIRDIHRPSQTSTRKNTLPTDSLFSCRWFIWSTVSYTKKRCREDHPEFFLSMSSTWK